MGYHPKASTPFPILLLLGSSTGDWWPCKEPMSFTPAGRAHASQDQGPGTRDLLPTPPVTWSPKHHVQSHRAGPDTVSSSAKGGCSWLGRAGETGPGRHKARWSAPHTAPWATTCFCLGFSDRTPSSLRPRSLRRPRALSRRPRRVHVKCGKPATKSFCSQGCL